MYNYKPSTDEVNNDAIAKASRKVLSHLRPILVGGQNNVQLFRTAMGRLEGFYMSRSPIAKAGNRGICDIPQVIIQSKLPQSEIEQRRQTFKLD